jgi:hypothetical protein
LSYTDLKKRVENKIGKHSSSFNDSVPAFMEFNFSSACSSVSECVVEGERRWKAPDLPNHKGRMNQTILKETSQP